MESIRIILNPVDFSEPSRAATRYALELAARLGAELHVVHVAQIPTPARPDGAELHGLYDEAGILRAAEDATEALRRELSRGAVQVTAHVRCGPVNTQVHAVAEEIGADLIVMGTHGRTGFEHVLLGSVAEKVVRTARLPVLTVPAPR